MAKDRVPLLIALQGGGSHGALGWGVLDRLLDEDRFDISAISGTSAGAMNAAFLASGIAKSGPTGAKTALRLFWRAVSRLGSFSPIQRSGFARASGNWSLDLNPAYFWFDLMSRVWSPYQTNPLNHHPLKALLTELLDLDALNSDAAPRVFLTATNVRTGTARVFTQPGITVDMILASAALPSLFQAVEIDGDPYWDGGYTGNPSLFPLVQHDGGDDLILIQTNPFERDETPKSARDIANRLNEITFNSALMKELRIAMHYRTLHPDRSRTRLHRVLCDADLAEFSPSAKLNVEWAYLDRLFEHGRAQASDFLEERGALIGHEASFDPAGMFEDMTHPLRDTGTPIREAAE